MEEKKITITKNEMSILVNLLINQIDFLNELSIEEPLEHWNKKELRQMKTILDKFKLAKVSWKKVSDGIYQAEGDDGFYKMVLK